MLLRSLFVFTLQSAFAFHLPDTVYITTPSTIESEAAESGIKTELSAPDPSNLNQFYQQHNYPQINIYPQQHYAPFLYRGPFLIMEHRPVSLQPNDQRSFERPSQNQESDSYVLYRPSPEDNPQFVDMLPPAEEQEEPNYYAPKPKKNKKYSEKVDGEKKKTLKKKKNLKEKIVKTEEDIEPENYVEVSDENPSRQERETEKKEEDYDEEPVETSEPASRLDFAMHGHKGPDTYKYGYDSGKGKNRQYKIEEKDQNGDVLGQYGYYDNSGKFRVVKYSVKKDDGFKVL